MDVLLRKIDLKFPNKIRSIFHFDQFQFSPHGAVHKPSTHRSQLDNKSLTVKGFRAFSKSYEYLMIVYEQSS